MSCLKAKIVISFLVNARQFWPFISKLPVVVVVVNSPLAILSPK